MLDGTNTSPEWQQHPTDILILPVGAFEQHSVHLPLITDNLEGEHIARRVAEALDAALLPTVAIATSMEHTGFRGSFSLRPETLMQIVRDIADEAERQHFRILIVLNAHGGNHALVPVCRDINRRDRPLKILLVNYWEYGERKIINASRRPGIDVHANGMETSFILALRPDLVRPHRADANYAAEPHPLVQSDLTTFGIGHMNPTGALGWPSEGNAADGHALAESLATGLIAHLRDRIARLRANPRYAGPGGLTIRPLTPADIPAGLRLKSCAGWNQTEADWRMLLAAAPTGCFGMAHQGAIVGTVTTTPYGPCAWIGMVLVDPAFRGIGIATRLMEQALAHLGANVTAKLDATPAGRTVYARMGFQDEYGLRRFIHPALPALTSDTAGTRPMTAADLPAVLAWDKTAFGSDRSAILRALFANTPAGAWVVETGGRLTGYALSRPGTHFTQLGPLVASAPASATRLMHAALQPLRGRPVLLDVPDAQPEFADLLAGAGFVVERPFTRMFRGRNSHAGSPRECFAAGGPEIG